MSDVLALQEMETNIADTTGEQTMFCSASSGSTAGCSYYTR
jgi:hypothetical protein